MILLVESRIIELECFRKCNRLVYTVDVLPYQCMKKKITSAFIWGDRGGGLATINRTDIILFKKEQKLRQ